MLRRVRTLQGSFRSGVVGLFAWTDESDLLHTTFEAPGYPWHHVEATPYKRIDLAFS